VKVCVQLGITSLLLVLTAFGQSAKGSLKNIYPQEPNGAFILKPGVTMSAVYGSHDQACVFTISGPISRQELMNTFETVVPKSRGGKHQTFYECDGLACFENYIFKNVYFTSFIVHGQTSEPDALIVFKSKDCQRAARNAEKITFVVKRAE